MIDEARAIAERLWPGRPARLEVLGGGITNHNVKVDLGDEAYVVRIAGRDSGLLGIDRRVEHEAAEAAAAVGVGPEVVALVEPEGSLVTRFIAGAIVEPERMRDPEVLRRITVALRAFHQGPPLAGRFNAFRIVEEYRTTAFERGVAVPPAYAWARQIARQIERIRGAFPERPCHNDLLGANFIDDGRRLRIVDWEYAGMGDVFFDLANFAVNNELDETGRRTLLEHYLGAVRLADEQALELMSFMSDFREAMWGVVQSAVSELEFDFAGYAARHFERMEAWAERPTFHAALRA